VKVNQRSALYTSTCSTYQTVLIYDTYFCFVTKDTSSTIDKKCFVLTDSNDQGQHLRLCAYM